MGPKKASASDDLAAVRDHSNSANRVESGSTEQTAIDSGSEEAIIVLMLCVVSQ